MRGSSIEKSRSAPAIARNRSASLIMNQYKKQKVPMSPKKNTDRYFIRNAEGQIARLAMRDRSPMFGSVDPYDPEVVNQVLNGENTKYMIFWEDW